MTTVLLFGTFDGLHEGHKMMLKAAGKYGDHVVAALAPDEVVLRLKNRPPNLSFNEREAALRASGLVDEVLGSDRKEGTYAVLEKVKPDIVVFGYDQTALALDFLRFLEETGKKMPTKILEAFAPERYKSSLFRNP